MGSYFSSSIAEFLLKIYHVMNINRNFRSERWFPLRLMRNPHIYTQKDFGKTLPPQRAIFGSSS